MVVNMEMSLEKQEQELESLGIQIVHRDIHLSQNKHVCCVVLMTTISVYLPRIQNFKAFCPNDINVPKKWPSHLEEKSK